jgi:hypothetical protein
MLVRDTLATTTSTTTCEYEGQEVARKESKTCLEEWRIASCGTKSEEIDLYRSLQSLTPESLALKGRRLQSLWGMNTGDSGLAEVRQRRLGFAQNLAHNWFYTMLDTQIADRESHHGQTTSKSSNPLNLGESRWEEEEENTRGFHGEASKPEGEDSGSSWRR